MPADVGGWNDGMSGREEGCRRRSCDQLEMGAERKERMQGLLPSQDKNGSIGFGGEEAKVNEDLKLAYLLPCLSHKIIFLLVTQIFLQHIFVCQCRL